MHHTSQSSIDGCLGCFRVLHAALNLGVHVSFQIRVFVFAGYMVRNGIARSYGSPMFSLLKNFHIVFQKTIWKSWLHQLTFAPTAQEDSLFSTSSSVFIICRLFNDGHSDWCEVVPYCTFDVHFSNKQQCRASFHVPVGRLYGFCGEMSIQVFCSFLIFFSLSFMHCLSILELSPCQLHHLQILSPISQAVFFFCCCFPLLC